MSGFSHSNIPCYTDLSGVHSTDSGLPTVSSTYDSDLPDLVDDSSDSDSDDDFPVLSSFSRAPSCDDYSDLPDLVEDSSDSESDDDFTTSAPSDDAVSANVARSSTSHGENPPGSRFIYVNPAFMGSFTAQNSTPDCIVDSDALRIWFQMDLL